MGLSLSAAAAAFLFAGLLPQGDEPSLDLAREIQGWYEGSAGPGNQLKVFVQPAASSSGYSYSFEVTIQGKFDRTNVSIHGALTVEREGSAARLRWETARGSCDIPVRRAGDGFEGETLPGGCLTAFQKPVIGKWSFQLEPWSFRVRNVESGETLRFRKLPPRTPSGKTGRAAAAGQTTAGS